MRSQMLVALAAVVLLVVGACGDATVETRVSPTPANPQDLALVEQLFAAQDAGFDVAGAYGARLVAWGSQHPANGCEVVAYFGDPVDWYAQEAVVEDGFANGTSSVAESVFVEFDTETGVDEAERVDGWSFESPGTGERIEPEGVYEFEFRQVVTFTDAQTGEVTEDFDDEATVHASVEGGVAYHFPQCDNDYVPEQDDATNAVIRDTYALLDAAGLWADHYPDPIAAIAN